MISDKKSGISPMKLIVFALFSFAALVSLLVYGSFISKEKTKFPVNIPCRGNMLIEANFDNQRATLSSSLYFSFIEKNKILISLSGIGVIYDKENKIIEKRIMLRNIYYHYLQANKETATYSLTSSQINIDSVDNMDWHISSLLLLNSFFLAGQTDTLVLRKYDDNTMLIESNQSPIALCVFKSRL